ncbi:TPA: hypothetical protein ACGF3N_003624 [Vibrio cholerae]
MSNVIPFPMSRKNSSSKSSIEDEIKKLVTESVTKKEATPPKKGGSTASKKNDSDKLSMNVTGNHVIQAGGNVSINYAETKSIKKILPTEEQIGGNLTLKNGIMSRFDKLAKYRAELRGGSKAALSQAYKIMYSNFKRDFGIASDNSYTEIWLYPSSCADEIMEYLDNKIALTKQGRIVAATSKEGYVHTRPWLYQMEQDYAHILGMTDHERRQILKQWFGVETRSKLTDNEHWQFMNYLKLRIEVLDQY